MSTEKDKGKPDKEKLKLVVNYGGRDEKFSVKDDAEPMGAFRNTVMDEFGIQNGREELALFRLDNTLLDDGHPLRHYGLADKEQLILRQRRTGGG